MDTKFSVLVLGTGRSGSNVVLEFLRGHPYFIHTEKAEDKKVLEKETIPYQYLAKCDTYYLNWEGLNKLLTNNWHIGVVWSIRDPRDICLSKIYRGQPGNDVKELAEDATFDGCIADMEKMFDLYNRTREKTWVTVIKMEHVLLNPFEQAILLCKELGLEWDLKIVDKMAQFPSRMRVKVKKERYGNKIDKSQVGLWKRKYEIYDGFFAKNDYRLDELFEKVKYITKFFKYE